MIAGLLMLQADHIADEGHQDAFKEAEARVLAMARVHEKLYQSDDLGKIRMDEYLSELAEDLIGFRGQTDPRIALLTKMEPAILEIDRAICCGIILTELVTNSLKHAFSNRSEGIIEINIERIFGDEFALIVHDNGVGFPQNYTLERASSLGLRLVQAFAKRLQGEIRLEPYQGATVTMTFKGD